MKDMCGKVKGKHEFYLGMMSSVTFPLTLKVCACHVFVLKPVKEFVPRAMEDFCRVVSRVWHP